MLICESWFSPFTKELNHRADLFKQHHSYREKKKKTLLKAE